MILSGAILEIHIKNILHNYKYLSSISKNTITGATIKANGYGLGSLKIFESLYKKGCRHFFVATYDEGVELRKKFSKGHLYILNGFNKINIHKIIKYNNLIPIINSNKDLEYLQKITKNNKKIKINIGIHFDTGINRLGINIKNFKQNYISNNLNIIIILSHLASADEKNNNFNKIQNTEFKQIIKIFKNKEIKSIASSMGITLGKDYHYDLTRAGISLYGGHHNSKLKKYIKPVIKLKAEIIQIKDININEYIGYNQTFITKKKTTIAILAIGYADGISRKLGNKGYVFYKNYKFKILGRISMDSITIDITTHKRILKTGMFLDIINHNFDIEKFANQNDTISNEILTSISNRVKRVYV